MLKQGKGRLVTEKLKQKQKQKLLWTQEPECLRYDSSRDVGKRSFTSKARIQDELIKAKVKENVMER